MFSVITVAYFKIEQKYCCCSSRSNFSKVCIFIIKIHRCIQTSHESTLRLGVFLVTVIAPWEVGPVFEDLYAARIYMSILLVGQRPERIVPENYVSRPRSQKQKEILWCDLV